MKDPTPNTPDLMRSNLIALGDFNIEKVDDETLEALVDNDLVPHEKLVGLPCRTGEKPGKMTAYDQIT